MSKRLIHVGVVFLALYGLLFFRLEWIQIFSAEKLKNHTDNTRQVTMAFDQPRGEIRTADGEVIAQTVAVSGSRERLRQYPYGSMYSHLTGFISAVNGGSGIERNFNNFLSGSDLSVRIQDNRDFFIDRARTGQVELSIRHDVQLVTRAAMAGQNGAAVIIEPSSGAVLGMWSAPNFDPNYLSSHDLAAAAADFITLRSSTDQPLQNRAEFLTHELGPLFTLVTATAAIEADLLATEAKHELSEGSGTKATSETATSSCIKTLSILLTKQCTNQWKALGEQIGQSDLSSVAKRFGLTDVDPLRLEGSPIGNLSRGALDSSPAAAAIGENFAASPLQVAHLFATIANNGTRMQPQVVRRILAHNGDSIKEFAPKALEQSVSKETAAILMDALAEKTRQDSWPNLQENGPSIAGLTASRLATGDHIWSAAIAPVTQPEVVVVVLLEGDDQFNRDTADATISAITGRIIEAVLRLPSSNMGSS